MDFFRDLMLQRLLGFYEEDVKKDRVKWEGICRKLNVLLIV